MKHGDLKEKKKKIRVSVIFGAISNGLNHA